MANIEVIQADITTLKVDAIVNAANSSLMGGGGVDGAIHDAAGPKLKEECKNLAPCPTGEARITAGHNLAARHVIHTVGPVWRGGNKNEDELLAACYRNSLSLAIRHQIRSIAFPAISTGAFGFPMKRAAKIAVEETERIIRAEEGRLERVYFVCFGREAYEAYGEAVRRVSE